MLQSALREITRLSQSRSRQLKNQIVWGGCAHGSRLWGLPKNFNFSTCQYDEGLEEARTSMSSSLCGMHASFKTLPGHVITSLIEM